MTKDEWLARELAKCPPLTDGQRKAISAILGSVECGEVAA
jgi:hypothetical protein